MIKLFVDISGNTGALQDTVITYAVYENTLFSEGQASLATSRSGVRFSCEVLLRDADRSYIPPPISR
jgi:hypothetical protein